jgi:uncharacterized protein with HEPN domain
VKDDRPYLLHIRDAVGKIEEYTKDGREVFFIDSKTQDAVLRKLEVIGEAVKHLSDSTKDRAPEIPWRAISGLRDKLIHEYFGVNLTLVWEVVERDLPTLRRGVTALLGG